MVPNQELWKPDGPFVVFRDRKPVLLEAGFWELENHIPYWIHEKNKRGFL
jgi:hypothetical protein